jgi:N-acetylglucosaminyl-diphospho-decaprenol L-rhamnosyltransferase
MDVSIIILSYNTRDLLRACLRSVAAGTAGLTVETIVVDNGSADGSAEMVAREFPEAVLIAHGANLGFAGGNNRAIERCSGRFVLLLNADAALQRATLAALVGYLERHPRVGAAGPRLLNTDGSFQPSAFGFPTLGRMALAVTRLSRLLLGHTERGCVYRPEAAMPVDWVTAACVMVRREAIAAVGLLDERFFFDFEDVDWCRRLWNAGWEVHAVPEAVATHHRWQSKAQLSDLWLLGDESACRYFRKHHGAAAEGVVRALLVWFHTCAWAKYGVRAVLTGSAEERRKRDWHRLGVTRFWGTTTDGRRPTTDERLPTTDHRLALGDRRVEGDESTGAHEPRLTA